MTSTLFAATTDAVTPRAQQKAQRHAALLEASAHLFAQRGYAGVSLEDIGAAVGVSGPAVYRHFDTKQALLGAILLRTSEHLLTGGQRVCAAHTSAADRIEHLVRFHVDFALRDADIIRVQDRDLTSLTEADQRAVRRMQRAYVELWVDQLVDTYRQQHPDAPTRHVHAAQRLRAHAVFGLINSTPHSIRDITERPDADTTRETLVHMALAALRTEVAT